MKPHRLALTHSLVLNYGLYKKMEVSDPPLIGGCGYNLSLCAGLQTIQSYCTRHVSIPC